MIFGKEYDLCLWYMLKVRNQHRRKAIELIKELPEDFLNNIRTASFEKINRVKDVPERSKEFYYSRSNTNPRISYNFNFNGPSLNIDKYIDGKTVFSIMLSPITPQNIMKVNETKQKELGLGCFGIGEYPKINYRELDYDLKNTNFGNMIIYTHVLLVNLIELKFYRPVNLNNIPDELYRDTSFQRKLIKN